MTAFDLRGERHRLKQLTDDGNTKLFTNRDGVECPACRTAFERLFVTERAATSFPENDGSRFCLLNESDAVYVFRH
ncbi:DUF7385 family protein [Natronomonas sp.]|uniref:DUF7385 family protein n=1 Tax=Natronomonas sp. TaxID=2184060 RepID=UPI0026285121|nr:flagella cluster protein [Natronomonas sp.]